MGESKSSFPSVKARPYCRGTLGRQTFPRLPYQPCRAQSDVDSAGTVASPDDPTIQFSKHAEGEKAGPGGVGLEGAAPGELGAGDALALAAVEEAKVDEADDDPECG